VEQSTVDYYTLPFPICQLDEISLDKSLLWVIHADKTPVHLGLSSNGSYFSLKKKGKDEHLSIEILLELLTRKQIPTLVFLLSKTIELSSLSESFSQYHKTKVGEVSCIQPVLNSIGAPSSIPKVHELIEYLFLSNAIKTIFGMHLTSGFIGIPNYSVDAIDDFLTL
jgi:hypothetical protein